MARPWLSRTDLVIVGLSATRRTWLSPAPAENDWKAKIFTPRSASAWQVLPRVPGRSCILMVNSLDVGMVGTSFASSGNAGRTLGWKLPVARSYASARARFKIGELALGKWQSIILAELDGPRERPIQVQFLRVSEGPEK